MKRLSPALLVIVVGIAAFLIAGQVGDAAPRRIAPVPLPQPTTGFQGNVQLYPPGALTPAVSADAAESAALQQLAGATVQSMAPQLALFSWTAAPVDVNGNPTGPPYYQKTPVWVVVVTGPCGATSPVTGDCLSNVMNVVVDATTGKFIMAYGNDPSSTTS